VSKKVHQHGAERPATLLQVSGQIYHKVCYICSVHTQSAAFLQSTSHDSVLCWHR